MRWMIAAAAVGLAFSAYANDVGEIKTMGGTVHVERGAQRLQAVPGMNVRQSDIVVTGADGRVGITFSDNTLLSAGPGSVLSIDHYSFDSRTHAGRFDASLKKGSLAVVSGKMVKQSSDALRVRTPATVMAVRGTEFVVTVTELDR